MGLFNKLFGGASPTKKYDAKVAAINALEPQMAALTDAQLRAKTGEFRARLKEGESLDDLLVEAFAVVREAGKRVLGMRHFDVQLIGGMVLNDGNIAEMKTGEGKTLVATLPSYLNALAGEGVHVVTVNDYLAKRDAEWMGKLHRFLGLSVGVILSQMPAADRRAAYACDITYGTNSEFGFDYLRDNMCVYKKDMVQRELPFAIVDEVDSILIDEARTPLIISGSSSDSSEMYERADKFVKTLKRGEDQKEMSKYEMLSGEDVFANSGDYSVDPKRRTVTLTASGVEKAERYFNVERLTDIDNTELNHYIQQALRANAVFKKDVDYVVTDGKVMIVDEFTGRIMYGRRYSEGLHQAIEAKEGVAIKNESKTLATITYQNYFRMYKKLSGMTGTAKTEEAEFMGIYGLEVVEIPTNRPNIRKDYDDQIYLKQEYKFDAIVDEICEVHATGRPVLVGTVSVERSEHVSELLRRRGVKHEVLNAKNHRKEAEIIAQAGKVNAVTIATNMAGRGTDILLGGNPDYLARREMRRREYDEEMIEEATGHAETDNEEILAAREVYRQLHEEYKKETDREHDEVVRLGGLHIIGTERHDSRRIDNQLRGRAARQGDPGSTRFYLSFDDDLLRFFGGEGLKSMMTKLSTAAGSERDGMQLGMLTKQIENAQKRVEQMHFNARKNVLQYDDVMNKQREIIYAQRRRVLLGEDVSETVQQQIESLVNDSVNSYCAEGATPRPMGSFGAGHLPQPLLLCSRRGPLGEPFGRGAQGLEARRAEGRAAAPCQGGLCRAGRGDRRRQDQHARRGARGAVARGGQPLGRAHRRHGPPARQRFFAGLRQPRPRQGIRHCRLRHVRGNDRFHQRDHAFGTVPRVGQERARRPQGRDRVGLAEEHAHRRGGSPRRRPGKSPADPDQPPRDRSAQALCGAEEGGPQRSLPLRQRQKVQKLLRQKRVNPGRVCRKDPDTTTKRKGCEVRVIRFEEQKQKLNSIMDTLKEAGESL